MGHMRIAAGLAGLVVLAGCAAPPPPPAPKPADLDGVYYGTSTRFRAESRTCPHPGLVTLHVSFHNFLYPWDYADPVDAVIGPDGTIQGNDPTIRVTGHAADGRIVGDIQTDLCGLHFTAYRHPPGSK